MEGSVKINGKKKLPSIPSNYVTLLQLQERWIKEKERNQKEEKEGPQLAHEEKETKAEERAPDEVAGRESRKNGHFRRYDRENWKRVAEVKSREEEIAKDFTVHESEDVENEKKGEKLKSEKKKKKNKKWKKSKKKNKEEKARADNEGEEVGGPAVNAPLPARTENNEGDEEEEVIKDEVHAPKLASVEEENVEGRRESKPRIITRTDGRTPEIGLKFREMPRKVEIKTGDYCRYGRQNGNFNHRGGNTELNRRYYGRRSEQNQRNEGLVWVKKGGVCDGNASGNQSSS